MTIDKSTRRRLLRQGLAYGAGALAADLSIAAGSVQAARSAPTPDCEPAAAPTRSSIEGPFYTPRPPLKGDLRVDAHGEPMVLVGFVLGADCKPVAGASVDLWHADSQGRYDNDGYRLRGWQPTDAQGRYRFETIVPGQYAGRTRHLHVKLRASNGRVLTTQLYFPDDPRNERDSLFDRRLVMDVEDSPDGRIARFDFILA